MPLAPLLAECPECGGTDLEPADCVDESVWTDMETACNDCTRVFDARGRCVGGFDTDVANGASA